MEGMYCTLKLLLFDQFLLYEWCRFLENFFEFFIVESISVDDVLVPVVIKRKNVQFSNCHLYSILKLHHTTPIFGRNVNSVPYGPFIHLTNWIGPY